MLLTSKVFDTGPCVTLSLLQVVPPQEAKIENAYELGFFTSQGRQNKLIRITLITLA